jgi:DNA-binding CsgD family transcriptional regulator
MMDIKLTTVKTHVSHILEKLDVNRRSEAKTAARPYLSTRRHKATQCADT